MKKLFALLIGALLSSCDLEVSETYTPSEDLCVKRIDTWHGGSIDYHIGPRTGRKIYFIIRTKKKGLDLGDTFYFTVKRKDGSIENFRPQ